MANCAKCGAAVAADSAFCGACGQAVNVAAAGSSVGAAPAISAPGNSAAGLGLTMNLAAALSYALGLITGILFLVLEPYKNNKLVRFHAMQSILFSAACIAGFWVLTVDVPLRLLIGLAIFGFWLYLMFQAYSEREYRIPWLGDFAAKLGLSR